MKQSMTMRQAVVMLALMAALLTAMVVVGTKPAHAATTFTVTKTQDTDDGVCNFDCSLREAISAANAAPGADTIEFNIGPVGLKTIKPTSSLPYITEAVTIDGYSQPGAKENTNPTGAINAELRIELSGENAGLEVGGLFIDAPNVVVRGLVINRFDESGIAVGDIGSRIEGNFIGTDPSGTLDRGNKGSGVSSTWSATIVGGTTPEARNLISGNDQDGVHLRHGTLTNAKVQGNLIGTTVSGNGDLGNELRGVYNWFLSSNILVGGASAAAANTIAFNGLDGVTVGLFADSNESDTTGNRILRNSIFSNGGQGIDLGNDGPTANDAGDADTGPNGLQNKPNLTSATNSAGTTTIKGKLSSKPNQTFRVQFFSNPSGNEGEKYIGQKKVKTDGSGKVSFTFKPANKVPVGQTVTATATSASNDTSEFSAPRAVTN